MKTEKWLARAIALFIITVSAIGMHAARVTSKGAIATTASYLTISR